MKHFLIILGLILASIEVNGQFNNSQSSQNFEGKSPRGLLRLTQIIYKGGKYYHDGNRVKFENVVLLLKSVDDKEINRNLKRVRILDGIRRPMSFFPLLFSFYLVSGNLNNKQDTPLLAGILVGSIITTAWLSISSFSLKKRTIGRYNEIVIQLSSSFSPSGGVGVGLGAKF